MDTMMIPVDKFDILTFNRGLMLVQTLKHTNTPVNER